MVAELNLHYKLVLIEVISEMKIFLSLPANFTEDG